MKTNLEIYEDIRKNIKAGDIFLTRGDRWISRAIQIVDKAYYNHIGILDVTTANRILCLDSNEKGIEIDLFSKRIEDCLDFAIIRPEFSKSIERYEALEYAYKRLGDKIKYDFGMILRVGIRRLTMIDFQSLGKDNRDICSEYVKQYLIAGNISVQESIISPQQIIDSVIPFTIIYKK